MQSNSTGALRSTGVLEYDSTSTYHVQMTNNIWYHLAILVKNGGISIFINGKESEELVLSNAAKIENSNSFIMMQENSCLDELFISNEIVSGSEAKKFYRSYTTGAF